VAAWQEITQEFWEVHRTAYDLYTSELVVEGASIGDSEAAKRRTMKDGIIEELWLARDKLAEKYEHDLDLIVAAIREREKRPLTVMCEKRTASDAEHAGGNSLGPRSRR